MDGLAPGMDGLAPGGDIPFSAIEQESVAPLQRYMSWSASTLTYFDAAPGREHYRLLAWLARQHRACTFLDIGTYMGASAVALSAEPSNRVVSYDIVDLLPPRSSGQLCARDLPNVELRLGDCSTRIAELLQELGDVKVVVLDVDPHDGEKEARFLGALRAAGYRGIVVLDDITLNPEMMRMWHGIPEPKRDISPVGHWSGTGIVFMQGGGGP